MNMKPIRLLFSVLLLACFCSAAGALNWQDVSLQADQQSNDIISAQKLLDSYRWSYLKAYSPILPQVSANLNAGDSMSGGVDNKNYGYGISASQTLFKGFSNTVAIQNAWAQFQYQQASFRNTQAAFNYTIRSAFIDLLVAQQNMDVQKQILDSRAENARLLKLLYDSGKEDRGNYLKAEAQRIEAVYYVDSAKRDLELAQFRLSQYIGSTPAQVEGSFEVSASLEVDFQSLTEQAPTFLMAEYQLEMAQLNKKSTMSEFLPSVSLNGSYQKNGGDWSDLTASKSLSLNVSMPIFPGASNVADYQIYSYRLQSAEQIFEKAKKDTLFGIKSAAQDLTNALQALQVQKDYVEAAKERSKIAQVKYLSGLITYDIWDQTQNEYVNYQRGLINYGRSALLSEASWYQSFGGWVK